MTIEAIYRSVRDYANEYEIKKSENTEKRYKTAEM